MANLSNINGKFVVEQTTGYVGVGTTDPNYPIEILNASAEIALNASGGSIYRVQSDNLSNFIIRKAGVGDRLVINSAGNATFAGNVTAPELRLQGTGTTYLNIGNNTTGSTSSDGASIGYFTGQSSLQIVQRENDAMVFSTNSDERMRITSGGDMQFNGNATISSNTADGSDNAQIIISGGGTYGDTRGASVHISGNESGNGGLLQLRAGNGSISQIRSYTSGVERIRVNADGTTKFNANILVDVINNSANSANIIYRSGTSTLVGGGTTANKLYVLDNGSIGIGTTSPDSKLHVESTSATGANFILESTHSGGIPLLDLKGAASAQLRYKDESNVIQGRIDFGDSGTFNFIDVPNNKSTLYLKTGGNVGIGTTSPDKRLTVGGVNPTEGINLKTKSGSNVWTLWSVEQYFSQEGYMRLFYDNVSRIQFRANDDSFINGGNVGIGTTSPRAKLEVDGELIVKDIKHSNFAVASLNTTGYTIATVTGSGNGASAVVEFTGIGGTNGVVDVVYSCTNQGGNWYAAARPRQTAVKVDVVVTGNGTTTLSFVFKSLSGTQGYTPRLMMKGSPPVLVTF